jgi:hypothetical protein
MKSLLLIILTTLALCEKAPVIHLDNYDIRENEQHAKCYNKAYAQTVFPEDGAVI